MRIRAHHVAIGCVVALAVAVPALITHPRKSFAGCSGFDCVSQGVQHLSQQGTNGLTHLNQQGTSGLEHLNQQGTNTAEHLNQQATNTTTKFNTELTKAVQKLNTEGTNGAESVNTWVAHHPAAVAAIVAIGLGVWAVCIDGCTLLITGELAGVSTTAAVASIADQPKQSDHDANVASGDGQPDVTNKLKDNDPISDNPQATKADAVQPAAEVVSAENGNEERGFTGNLEKEWPGRFSRKEYPDGATMDPIVRYKSLEDSLGGIFNTFAYPTLPILVRTADKPDGDPAGGDFLSPRGLLGGANADIDAEAKSLWGKDARRNHGSFDMLAWPGQPVVATLTGTIEAAGPMKSEPPLHIIVIRTEDGTVARELYVQPNPGLLPGTKVEAGVTIVGHVEAIDRYSPYKGVPNHVHIDFMDNQGRHFDPWTNRYVDERRIDQHSKP